MNSHVRRTHTVTAAQAASSAFQAVTEIHPSLPVARTHVWHVTNNATTQSTVQPQGSLSPGNDGFASDWVDLNGSATNIASGATARITVVDEPALRVRLDVSTLDDNDLEVEYVGMM